MANSTTDREIRDDFARKILSGIVRRGIAPLPVSTPDGRKPIVCALDHELLSEVMQRIENAGGLANTFVLGDSGKVVCASFLPARGTPGGFEDLGADPVHEDIRIGMFLAVVEQYGAGVTARIRLPRHSSDVAEVSQFALS